TGRAGGSRNRQAHRPLPVLSRLHDDLPVRSALHAPGRSRPPPYRGILPPPLGGAVIAALAWPGAEPAGPDALGAPWRSTGKAVCHAVAAAITAAHRAGAARYSGGVGKRPSANLPGRGGAADAGCAIARLRPAGAHARDQRG